MKKKAGTKMVSYFMIYNKEPLLPITVSFLLPPTKYDETILERLAIMTIDGRLSDREALELLN
jgi:hypothetical protein